MRMNMRTMATVTALTVLPALAASQGEPRPTRTFPQLAGSWVLDETASTGRLEIAPRIPRTLTIETTPEAITVMKRPRLQPRDRASDSPPPEVYRLDGSETRLTDARTGVALERTHRFTLVADMLALTVKEARQGSGGGFTLVTDAYAVEGDVLTMHRQLSSINAAGQMYVMQEPANNFRHTFIYRRGR